MVGAQRSSPTLGGDIKITVTDEILFYCINIVQYLCNLVAVPQNHGMKSLNLGFNCGEES